MQVKRSPTVPVSGKGWTKSRRQRGTRLSKTRPLRFITQKEIMEASCTVQGQRASRSTWYHLLKFCGESWTVAAALEILLLRWSGCKGSSSSRIERAFPISLRTPVTSVLVVTCHVLLRLLLGRDRGKISLWTVFEDLNLFAVAPWRKRPDVACKLCKPFLVPSVPSALCFWCGSSGPLHGRMMTSWYLGAQAHTCSFLACSMFCREFGALWVDASWKSGARCSSNFQKPCFFFFPGATVWDALCKVRLHKLAYNNVPQV